MIQMKIPDLKINEPQKLTLEALKPAKTQSKNANPIVCIENTEKAKKEIRERYQKMLQISKILDQHYMDFTGHPDDMKYSAELSKKYSKLRDEIFIINGDRNLYQEVQHEMDK